MKQRKPDTFKEFIIPFWLHLFAAPFLVGMLLGVLSDDTIDTLERVVASVSLFAIFMLFWLVLKLLHKSGFADALYAHYLKRWEEKEKQEAAKLYLGRKEE